MEGCTTTDSFVSIPNEDMIKLGEYFDQEGKQINFKKLQNSVLFCIMYFLCRCGRENLHNMRKDTFGIFTDASGAEYLAQKRDELDKNHQANSTSWANEGKIYARSGKQSQKIVQQTLGGKHCAANSWWFFHRSKLFCANYSADDMCPVRLFKLYLSKLNPKIDSLWQKPKKKPCFVGNDECWYEVPPPWQKHCWIIHEESLHNCKAIKSLHKSLCKKHLHSEPGSCQLWGVPHH